MFLKHNAFFEHVSSVFIQTGAYMKNSTFPLNLIEKSFTFLLLPILCLGYSTDAGSADKIKLTPTMPADVQILHINPTEKHKIIGVISVKKTFLDDLQKPREAVENELKEQAAALGGEAIINIVEERTHITGAVIVFTSVETVNTKENAPPTQVAKAPAPAPEPGIDEEEDASADEMEEDTSPVDEKMDTAEPTINPKAESESTKMPAGFLPGQTVKGWLHMYVSANIWYTHPGKILTTNYHSGKIIPIGTMVNVKIGRQDTVFTLFEGKGKFRIIHARKHNPSYNMSQWANYYFSGTDPMKKLGQFNELERKNILAGKLEVGMSKDAAVMAYGVPPSHRTSALFKNIWIYWIGKRETVKVQFENDRIVNIDPPMH